MNSSVINKHNSEDIIQYNPNYSKSGLNIATRIS